jgi:uncharacterized protein (TIGR00251 family)
MEKIIVKDSSIILEIFVKPNSKVNKLILEEEAILVQIKDSPVKGKANKSLIQFLSKFFNISKNQVSLIAGTKSKTKKFLLRDLDKNQKNRIIQLLEE